MRAARRARGRGRPGGEGAHGRGRSTARSPGASGSRAGPWADLAALVRASPAGPGSAIDAGPLVQAALKRSRRGPPSPPPGGPRILAARAELLRARGADARSLAGPGRRQRKPRRPAGPTSRPSLGGASPSSTPACPGHRDEAAAQLRLAAGLADRWAPAGSAAEVRSLATRARLDPREPGAAMPERTPAPPPPFGLSERELRGPRPPRRGLRERRDRAAPLGSARGPPASMSRTSSASSASTAGSRPPRSPSARASSPPTRATNSA